MDVFILLVVAAILIGTLRIDESIDESIDEHEQIMLDAEYEKY